MRLLNTKTFELSNFILAQAPDYVILSHRWEDEELTFQDVISDPPRNRQSSSRAKAGFLKIQGACDQARQDGYDWIWIDSCCIDRASSADLQTDINSMWNYYTSANICYAYMSDVSSSEDHPFHKSIWWSRGWTLQELLAPDCVEFYDQEWASVGTKAERYEEIAEITHISQDALTKSVPFDHYSAAEKLSWAAHRAVTREEDEAYALLGLFQVNMPLLYGEGRERAFFRLQEAIYIATTDSTLFLFRYSPYPDQQPLLADCPTRFCPQPECKRCEPCAALCFPSIISYDELRSRDAWCFEAHESIYTTINSTRNEVSTTLKLLKYGEVSRQLNFVWQERPSVRNITHVAILNYTLQDHPDAALCLLLHQDGGDAFSRLRYFPALLPNVRQYESKMKQIKILICPQGPPRNPGDDYVNVHFTLSSKTSSVKWQSRRAQSFWEHDSSCQIQVMRFPGHHKPAEVIAAVSFFDRASPVISIVEITLKQFSNSWSIKEVAQLRSGAKAGDPFTSTRYSDRCSIDMLDGKIMTVRLRRMAASQRTRSGGPARSIRYQLALDVP